MGQPKSAIDDCNTALKLDDRRVDALVQRAAAYSTLGELKLAIVDCGSGIALDPKSFYFWSLRGSCRQQLGKLDEAVADYKQALKLKPNESGLSAVLAAVQRQAGIKDEKPSAPLSANTLNELRSRSKLGKALRDFDAAAAEIIGKQGNTDNPSTPIAPATTKR